MQTNYLYSSYSGLSISTPVVTSQFLSSQIKVIYVFSSSYPHSYQSIPLLSETPDNNSVLLKYATTRATVDRDTAHELRPRLFLHLCCQLSSTLGHSAPAPHVPDIELVSVNFQVQRFFFNKESINKLLMPISLSKVYSTFLLYQKRQPHLL